MSGVTPPSTSAIFWVHEQQNKVILSVSEHSYNMHQHMKFMCASLCLNSFTKNSQHYNGAFFDWQNFTSAIRNVHEMTLQRDASWCIC